MNLDFYRGKSVFITGHTGFKGSWLTAVLLKLGATVTGYALDAPTEPSLFNILNLKDEITSVTGDIRDLEKLTKTMQDAKPDIAIHMAAQPIVRDSYKEPVYTYETNVMGTVNFLEAVRKTPSVKSVINVTTDKVYLNREWDKGYVETDELNGFDPYSNSKSCSELVTSSYINSFFTDEEYDKNYGIKAPAVTTMRAGNVIGGGDFANDRIIPDCVRALEKESEIAIRNPYSVRPFQHVLEPVCAYLMVAKAQYEDRAYAGNYNIGPEDSDAIMTGELVSIFCDCWNRNNEAKELCKASWTTNAVKGPHEAGLLKLNCDKIKRTFGWEPKWNINETLDRTVEWYMAYLNGDNVKEVTDKQIHEFMRK
ncbi:MAG: CDP-glucose 4,6-dehydratase [Lachnospiraceae bacterium]|nr:CDP-glucose 4,6-dehydratase [Lachnospiraceae bacterium]